MARQGRGRAAHGLVVRQIDRARAGCGPLRPGARQHMLHHRQIVEAVAHLVQQPLHQARCNLLAAQLDRPDDGLFALLARQARHQVGAGAHSLGQAHEVGTAAQSVRAQRQHHADGPGGVGSGLQQQLDEGAGLVGVGQALEAEDLLKLVHHQQQPAACRQPGQPDHLQQAQATQPQLAQQRRSAQRQGIVRRFVRCFVWRGRCGRLGRAGGHWARQGARQGHGQVGQRPVAGLHHRAQPGTVAGLGAMLGQAAQQPRLDQRRFAATRRTRHGQQRAATRQARPAIDQAAHQGVDLGLAAEKPVGLGRLERAQAREGVGRQQRRSGCHAPGSGAGWAIGASGRAALRPTNWRRPPGLRSVSA